MMPLNRPIVGVFIDHSVILRLNKQKTNFRSYQRILEMAKASVEAEVTLYYFSIKNFDFKQNLILGTSFDVETNQWKQEYFPLPDILYNRRAGGGASKFIVEHIEDILDQHKVIKINTHSYFNKWEVYQELSQMAEVSQYLPYSVMYQDESDLKDFLKLRNEAYLKGVRGGRGRWIYRVRKKPEGKFEYSYFVNKMVREQVDSWEELINKIRKFYKSRNFIIQKTINLIQFNGSKVDFRAELQRNGEGELTIVGVCARIGKSNSPITIHSSAYPIEEFFKEFLYFSDEDVTKLMERVHQFLYSIYESLEKVYGKFGEIGIDFGIDEEGEIWFIEPNSKSAKVSLMKAYDQETFHQAFLNPLLYSKYLYRKKRTSDDQE
ncbi:YheC/YheD family protein [Mesobacillus maritimus]|uniref:YheC/YheD family endospore coat-associated protein n=1 Tax=Mesobacillus maritimus TaxID=1643336 RepID=UPI002041B0C5|nr:YheC/YheD family protein [Mesobacillus maritimus]MCM3584655.1 YheC/YheD family protein [Mesobacillus maritimus]